MREEANTRRKDKEQEHHNRKATDIQEQQDQQTSITRLDKRGNQSNSSHGKNHSGQNNWIRKYLDKDRRRTYGRRHMNKQEKSGDGGLKDPTTRI